MTYNRPYLDYYYSHPAYSNFPVVGISHEQAKAYCIWRTYRVKQFLITKKNYRNIDFSYRLPTKNEWEFLANVSFDVFENNGIDEKGYYKLNIGYSKDTIKSLYKIKRIYKSSDITCPVNSHKKNQFGIYNMIGNVAEMVNEKGICKGGSWKDSLENCRIGKDIPYQKPTAWLGFRCVCIVKQQS